MGKIWIKLLISSGILAYLFLVKIKISVLSSLAGKVNPLWFLLALSLHIVGYLISGIRWKSISGHLKIELPLLFYIKSYLVATFFGFFLPSRFGGDVVRVADLMNEKGLSSGLSTVFYERIIGLLSMVSMGIPVLFLLRPEFKKFFLFSMLLMGGVLGISLLVLFKPRVISGLIPVKKIRGKLIEVENSISSLRVKGLFLKTLAWSFALQINVIIYYWAIGKAVGMEIGLLHYFYLIPTMLILMAIPISFQGMGIRDYFAVSVFPLYGALPEQGFLFSLADLAIAIFYAVVGFFVYLARK